MTACEARNDRGLSRYKTNLQKYWDKVTKVFSSDNWTAVTQIEADFCKNKQLQGTLRVGIETNN